MTATITRAVVVGGHDGRAEIEVEITYDNGATTTISLDEEACTGSLDEAGVTSIDELVGQPWNVVLPALNQRPPTDNNDHGHDRDDNSNDTQENRGTQHARSRHP